MGFRSYLSTLGPLACDLYALTMTQAAFRLGFVDQARSTSHVFCRSLVNNGQSYLDPRGDRRNVKMPYLVNAGLGLVGEWLDGWRFGADDLAYLGSLPSASGGALFDGPFLSWLGGQKLSLTIDAMPEGEMILPREPSLRVSGPWWQQQMVEATILSLVSSSTNQATMAAQVRLAARRFGAADLVQASATQSAGLAEMALRRTDSIGGLQASRAAMIAGWDSSSNVYAGKCYGIPVMGTFAHSWVMLHDTEEEAFDAWARAYPETAVFLADTYNSLGGVKKAIAVCKKRKIKLKGIRLDSGDMAYLSTETRALLKEAGFGDAAILATDSVSARAAHQLYGAAGSEVTGFGIGSEVAVNQYQPLLSEVMKLASVENGQGKRDVLKFSESREKATLPGEIDVIRALDSQTGRYAGDIIVAAGQDLGQGLLARDVVSVHAEMGTKKMFPAGTLFLRPIKPWMREGLALDENVAQKDAPAILRAARACCASMLDRLDPSHLRHDMPRRYGWGIEEGLLQRRDALLDARDQHVLGA